MSLVSLLELYRENIQMQYQPNDQNAFDNFNYRLENIQKFCGYLEEGET